MSSGNDKKKVHQQGAKKVHHRCTLTILKSIRDNGSVPWGVACKRSIKYALSSLLKDGKILKLGYGTWKITDTGIYMLQIQEGASQEGGSPAGLVTGVPRRGPDNITRTFQEKQGGQRYLVRGHRFKWKLRIESADYESILMRAGLVPASWITGLKGSVKASRIDFNGLSWHFFTKTLIITVPEGNDFFAPSALESEAACRRMVLSALEDLEKKGVKLRLNGFFNLSKVSSEFAELDNEIAKDFKKRKKGLLLRGDDGKPWLKIDASHGVPEFETVHPKLSQVDMDEKLKPALEFLRANPHCLHQMTYVLSSVQDQVFAIATGVNGLVKLFEIHIKKDREE